MSQIADFLAAPLLAVRCAGINVRIKNQCWLRPNLDAQRPEARKGGHDQQAALRLPMINAVCRPVAKMAGDNVLVADKYRAWGESPRESEYILLGLVHSWGSAGF